MVEIRFYHLQRQGLDEALPKLMEKVLETGAKTVIKVEDASLLKRLDTALWSYDKNSFLPHGASGGPYDIYQPALLTETDENPIEATIQTLVNAADSETTRSFEKCLYMFDGRDEMIVNKARQAWKKYKDLGVEMSYWQQRENGGWEKKA